MGVCCENPSLGADLSFQHEGEFVDVYGECRNCGATIKERFTFTHTEMVESGKVEV